MARPYSKPLKIFFDGGARPNPGRMETAVVARGKFYHRPDVGIGSNDEAEWLALLHAVEVAKELGAEDVVFLGDSTLVVMMIAAISGAIISAVHLSP